MQINQETISLHTTYARHRGYFRISTISGGNFEALTPNQKETVDAVLKEYGDKTAQWLSDLTHMEDPWKNARQGLGDNERGNSEITLGAMSDYYGNLF